MSMRIAIAFLMVPFLFSSVLCKRQKRISQLTIATEDTENKRAKIKKSENRQAIKAAEDAARAPSTSKRKRRGKNLFADTPGEKKKSVKKTISTMNFQELKEAKELLVAQGNKEVAIKYLEKMIPLCTDMSEKAQIMIDLGDIYYEKGDLPKAFTMYREFVNLYPGSDQAEYALYRAIICKFDGISDPERDQTQTKETIELAEEFLERSDLFVTYKDNVEDILNKCGERLFENELSIFNFYVFNKRVVSANKRLDSMKKEFEGIISDCEARIMILEVELAQAQNNNELAEEKRNELVTKFPDYVVRTAQNVPKKKSWVDRF